MSYSMMAPAMAGLGGMPGAGAVAGATGMSPQMVQMLLARQLMARGAGGMPAQAAQAAPQMVGAPHMGPMAGAPRIGPIAPVAGAPQIAPPQLQSPPMGAAPPQMGPPPPIPGMMGAPPASPQGGMMSGLFPTAANGTPSTSSGLMALLNQLKGDQSGVSPWNWANYGNPTQGAPPTSYTSGGSSR